MRKLITLIITLLLAASCCNSQAVLNESVFTKIVVSVTDFGAVGDGKTLDWEAILKTFAFVDSIGGGTIIFPPGNYLSGPLNLTSNTHVILRGTVLASGDKTLYPSGRNAVWNGYGVSNILISGGGVMDGQGEKYWWPQIPSLSASMGNDNLLMDSIHNNVVLEPFLFECKGCNNVVVKDITMLNSPFWTVHPYNCSFWTISNLTIFAPINGPNIDCIDPDSSNNILIENSQLACGDDHVSVKASPGIPSYNIMIRNTKYLHGQGMTIGSEVRGGVWNVTFKDSLMIGGLVGMRFKTVRNRGGFAKDIYFQNLQFQSVAILLSINMDFDHNEPSTNKTEIPSISQVYFEDISGWGVMSMKMVCLPESPCTDMHLVGVNTVICQDFECANVSGDWRNCSHPVPCSALTHLT